MAQVIQVVFPLALVPEPFDNPVIQPIVKNVTCSYCKTRGHTIASSRNTCTKKQTLYDAMKIYNTTNAIIHSDLEAWVNTLTSIELSLCYQFIRGSDPDGKSKNNPDINIFRKKIVDIILKNNSALRVIRSARLAEEERQRVYRERILQQRTLREQTILNDRLRDLRTQERVITDQLSRLGIVDIPALTQSLRGWRLEVIIEPSIGVDEECPVCYEQTNDRFMTKLSCEHRFCFSCINEQISRHSSTARVPPCCGLCRTSMTKVTVSNEIVKKTFKKYL